MRMILKLSFVGLLLAATPAAAQSASEARDPKALAALDAMGAFLRTQTNMKVIGEINTDDVIGKNQKIQYSGTVELMVRRPDGLRANVVSDRKNEQIFYDGKQFTVYEPKLGYYAAFAAPPTLAGLVDVAERRYGLELPLVDLFAWGTVRSHPEQIITATRLGPSTVKGTPCDHYAFHQSDMDWQVWIQQGDRPLPRKEIITTTSEPTQPQYSAVYTWDLAPSIPPQAFTFSVPPGAHRIDFDVGRTAPQQQRAVTP